MISDKADLLVGPSAVYIGKERHTVIRLKFTIIIPVILGCILESTTFFFRMSSSDKARAVKLELVLIYLNFCLSFTAKFWTRLIKNKQFLFKA